MTDGNPGGQIREGQNPGTSKTRKQTGRSPFLLETSAAKAGQCWCLNRSAGSAAPPKGQARHQGSKTSKPGGGPHVFGWFMDHHGQPPFGSLDGSVSSKRTVKT